MNPLKSVKEYMTKRKAKSDAAAKNKMKADGPKRLKQIRGAYDKADSAFGNIHRNRKKKDKMLEDIMAGK